MFPECSLQVCQACRHQGAAVGPYRGVKSKKRMHELVRASTHPIEHT